MTAPKPPASEAYANWVGPAHKSVAFDPVAWLWLVSDTHIGAQTMDIAKLERHASYVRRIGGKAIHLGDTMEVVTTGSGVGQMGGMFSQFQDGQEAPINFQARETRRIFDGLLLAGTEGNHGARLARQGFDIDAQVYQELGAAYLGVLGEVTFGETRMLVSHGEGGGQRHLELRRLNYPGYDIYAAGHTHKLSVRMDADGVDGRARYMIMSGHYLGLPAYSLRMQYSGCAAPTGSVLLQMDPETGKVLGLQFLT